MRNKKNKLGFSGSVHNTVIPQSDFKGKFNIPAITKVIPLSETFSAYTLPISPGTDWKIDFSKNFNSSKFDFSKIRFVFIVMSSFVKSGKTLMIVFFNVSIKANSS